MSIIDWWDEWTLDHPFLLAALPVVVALIVVGLAAVLS
jgi:hypothetical protein